MLSRLLKCVVLLAAVVALLLCAMQVRSYWCRDFFKATRNRSYATSESGRLVIIVYGWPGVPRWASAPVTRPREYVNSELIRIDTPWQPGWRLDWGLGVAPPSVQAPNWVVVTPHALPAAAIVVVPLLACRGDAALTRRRRARRGQCPACGYDLRASPDRCPECGATPAA